MGAWCNFSFKLTKVCLLSGFRQNWVTSKYYYSRMQSLNIVPNAHGIPNVSCTCWQRANSTHFRENLDLNFENHVYAFRQKSTSEIIRALSILKLCSYDAFVNNSLKLMTLGQRILGERMFSALIRPTFYDQFVAGDDRPTMTKTIQHLQESNIRPMIAPMMEEDAREHTFDSNVGRILDCLHLTSSLAKVNPMMQVKISGIMSTNALVKLSKLISDEEAQHGLAETCANALSSGKNISELKGLDEQDIEALNRGLMRLREIGKAGEQGRVKILVDAEYVNINPALTSLSLALMAVHNMQKANVWDTYQCYLKSGHKNVSQSLRLATRLGSCFGAKIVRGAYMETERMRANQQGYHDPVNETYEATGIMYNRITDMLLQHGQKVGHRCEFIIATHNEDAIRFIFKRSTELGVDLQSGLISFGQLYGMCDQVTYPLAAAGLAVYKSIPYGRISEVLPYLYRRATENRAVLKGARKEQELLFKELKHRMVRR